ncbi:hypothetical protein [Rosistilla oblonga]|uniref:hypothetical protein n=1 Tax=Rosistilla oblonga TaxID=2527990 RepID=UPI003A96D2AA
MVNLHPSAANNFHWQPQPDAWRCIARIVQTLAADEPYIQDLAVRMLSETGTRLIDWVADIRLPFGSPEVDNLLAVGFVDAGDPQRKLLVNRDGMFPVVHLQAEASKPCLAIKVERLADFCTANGGSNWEQAKEQGNGFLSCTAVVHEGAKCDLAAVENHGSAPQQSAPQLAEHVAAFRTAVAGRSRPVARVDAGAAFDATIALFRDAVAKLGTGLACDIFFQSEREYWQDRNLAARLQKQRQDALGLGWGNHDHHTYRSSRAGFHRLIEALEVLGFVCRERFYAGADAGWGAQVLEQAEAGVIVFADVDLSPDEVAGDFAHQPLEDRSELGTVGLWCRLHGEAFLAAGMHHLECQFDFDAARAQLALLGIATMEPFTDFPFLRQAFTAAETWAVDPEVLREAVADGAITAAEAERFKKQGASGSHLEILERNDGYKGFNQTGISDIIQRTDPRNSSAV